MSKFATHSIAATTDNRQSPAIESIGALTGLRFFAAIYVVIYHATQDRTAGLPDWLVRLLAGGPIAVSFFFVLSGFILVHAYRTRSVRPAEFWGIRFARIYPLYGLGLIAIAIPRIAQEARSLTHISPSVIWDNVRCFVASALMVQAWVPGFAYRLNGPAWSVSVEMFFYLMFPLALPLLLQIPQRVWRAWWPLAIAFLWMVSIGSITGVESMLARYDLFQSNRFEFIVFNPLLRFPEFLMGMVAALGISATTPRINPTTAQVLTYTSLALAIVALLASREIPANWLHTSLLAPLFVGIIAGLRRAPNGPLAKMLALPTIVLLGEASYGMYILHSPIYAWIAGADTVLHAGIRNSAAWLPVYVATVCFVSILAYHRVEEPVRKRLRSWFHSKLGRTLPGTERQRAA